MRLFLVRHGQTANNVEARCQGWVDVELDEVGQAQAEAVASYFGPRNLDAIFTSDLCRAVATATPTSLLKGIDLEQTELLRERSLGELENAPITALRNAFDDEIRRTGESRYRARPMGVESAYDVMARVIEFTKLLPEKDVAVFTHGMTEEVLLCHLIGAPVESSRSFSFANASITTLRWDFDVWVLESYNDTEHLKTQ